MREFPSPWAPEAYKIMIGEDPKCIVPLAFSQNDWMPRDIHGNISIHHVDGGFNYFLCSPLLREDFQFD